MNRIFNIVTAMAALVFVLDLSSQASAQPAKFPDTKIALIYSDVFVDGKTGIAKFATLVGDLNVAFKPRETEINQLTQKAKALTDEIEKTQSTADPAVIRSKMDQLEQMKMELKRKAEDAEAAYDKRKKDVITPLQLDIGKALEAYAKLNGISIIIDGSQVPLVYAADALDITRAFINDFNTKNPVTASTPPK